MPVVFFTYSLAYLGRSNFGFGAAADSHFWLSYSALIVAGGARYAPYGPFFTIVSYMLHKTVAGEVMALINTCGVLGGFVGSWLVDWLQALTGNSRAGFLTMSVSLFISAGIILCLRTAKPESAAQSFPQGLSPTSH